MLSVVLLVLLAGAVWVAVYRLNRKDGSAAFFGDPLDVTEHAAKGDDPAPAPFANLSVANGHSNRKNPGPLDLTPHALPAASIDDLQKRRSQKRRPAAHNGNDDLTLPAGELARPGRPMGFDATREALICIYPSGAPRPAIEVRKTARGGSLVLADGKLLARLTTRDVTPGDIILCESARTCDEPLKKIA